MTDACGCCLECARLINNTCGGQYQSEGRCDEGLVCVIEPVEGSIITGHEIGICTSKNLFYYILIIILIELQGISSIKKP